MAKGSKEAGKIQKELRKRFSMDFLFSSGGRKRTEASGEGKKQQDSKKGRFVNRESDRGFRTHNRKGKRILSERRNAPRGE